MDQILLIYHLEPSGRIHVVTKGGCHEKFADGSGPYRESNVYVRHTIDHDNGTNYEFECPSEAFLKARKTWLDIADTDRDGFLSFRSYKGNTSRERSFAFYLNTCELAIATPDRLHFKTGDIIDCKGNLFSSLQLEYTAAK